MLITYALPNTYAFSFKDEIKDVEEKRNWENLEESRRRDLLKKY